MIELKTYNDKPLSVDLIRSTFEASFKQKFDDQYWKWRFLTNPVSSKIYIAYILDGSTLAAYYAVSPVIISDGNQQYKFALSNMTMTHPDHQGKGYFKQLAAKLYDELKADGFDGIVGFANHNSHYGFKTHLGWKDLSALMLFQSDKNSSTIQTLKSVSFVDSELNAESLSKLQNFKCTHAGKLRFNRNTEWLKWRLIDIPNKKYRVLFQVENNNTVAATVYKVYGTEIDVMEHFNTAEITESEKLRIEYSIGFFQNQYKGVINLWSNIHDQEHLVLEKLGFKETSFSTYFGIIPFTERSEALTNFSKWHFRFIDSDVF